MASEVLPIRKDLGWASKRFFLLFSYFQANDIATVKKIDVYNSLLHDFSDQQINIIHCTVGGKRQSTKLNYPNTSASFSW